MVLITLKLGEFTRVWITAYLPYPSVFPTRLLMPTVGYREVGSPSIGADVTATVRSMLLDAAFQAERHC